jgi:hypothetical protein
MALSWAQRIARQKQRRLAMPMTRAAITTSFAEGVTTALLQQMAIVDGQQLS